MRYSIIFLLFIIACQAPTKKEKTVEEKPKPSIKVQNVNFEQTENDTWIMQGTVINTGQQAIQGDIKIKLLGTQERELSTFSTPVNESQPIQPGDSARFKYEGPNEEFAGAKNYQFTFVPDKAEGKEK